LSREGLTSVQLAADRFSRVYVNRSAARPLPDDEQRLQQDFRYSGRDNQLVKESAYCLEFVCYYDLSWYPFDTQYCAINMSLLALNQVRPTKLR
jgi:hypothetical protein